MVSESQKTTRTGLSRKAFLSTAVAGIRACTLLVYLLITSTAAHAATYYWVGSGGNTNSGSNWRATAPTSGSDCNANGNTTVPQSWDDVVFDADCDGNATIATTNGYFTVTNFTTESGYGGTITPSNGAELFASDTFSFAGGTYQGANSKFAAGVFTLSGGTFTAPSGTLLIRDNFTITGGTFNHSNGNVNWLINLVSTRTYSFDAAGVSFNSVGIYCFSDEDPHEVTIAANTVIPAKDNQISGSRCNLTNNGTITLGTGTFENWISGTFTNNGTIRTKTTTMTNSAGGTFTNASGSTVEFIGDGDGAADSSALSSFATTYHHLIINATDGSSDTFTSASNLDINGNLTLTAGTLSAPSQINLAGDFSRTSGVFTRNTSTVVLDGTNQSISGSTTFNNLTKSVTTARTLTFGAGTTQTIAGLLTLNGAAGQLLSLRSSTNGSIWNINPQGSVTANYLDVKDSTNLDADVIYPTNSTDSGNNLNWFTAPTATPTSTPTHTPTSTPTSTPTNTPTSTHTSTPTNTPTATPTSTPTPSPTRGGPQSVVVTADSTAPLTDLNTGAGTMAVKFDISWNYSWRQSNLPGNWDAMWVFVKFRKNKGQWQQMTFTDTGHTAPAGATIDIGLRDPTSVYNISTNRGVGAFIYKSSNGFGSNTFNGVKLVWPYTQDGVQQGDPIDIQLHAIHMVYVPSGTFEVGDNNTSTNSFKQQSSNNPVSISSENEITVYEGATAYTVPAAFPKGHNDFYIMRHELNQEQWRNFFNSLPTTGNARTNRDITGSAGKNSDALTDRNNMSWDSSNQSSVATIPDRDPPNIATYCGVAANYLNWEDLTAYLDWAGLRPMSELEFEKAARGPTAAVSGEYAWGSASGTNASGITSSGRGGEVPSNGGANVNWSGGAGGPLRNGSFASLNYGLASRANAGGSYYGALELSGNVWERAVTVANSAGRAFTGAHGDGAVDTDGRADVSNWPAPTTAAGSGLRGGSWNAASTAARVSDRSSAATAATSRTSDYGGRGVRTAP